MVAGYLLPNFLSVKIYAICLALRPRFVTSLVTLLWKHHSLRMLPEIRHSIDIVRHLNQRTCLNEKCIDVLRGACLVNRMEED